MKLNTNELRKLSLSEVQQMLKQLMSVVDDFCVSNEIDYYIIGGTLLGAVRHKGFIPWDDDIDIAMQRDSYEKFLDLANKFPEPYEVVNFQNSSNCDFVLTRIYIPNTYIDNPAIRKSKLDKRLYFDIFPLDKTPGTFELNKIHSEQIKKLKSRIWWSTPYINSQKLVRRFVRKGISVVLTPFRNVTIKKLDRLMKKYRDSNSHQLCSMASQYSYEKQAMNFEIYGTPVDYEFDSLILKGPANSDAYLTKLFGENYMELPPVEKRRKGFDIYVKES